MDWAKFVSFGGFVEKVASNRLVYRGHVLVLVGVIFGAGALISRSSSLDLGVGVIAGLSLIAGIAYYIFGLAQGFLDRKIGRLMIDLAAKEPRPTAICNRNGRIVDVNDAMRRAGLGHRGDDIHATVGAVILEPQVIFARLMSQAKSLGQAAEFIETKDVSFRLVVQRLSADRFYWQLAESEPMTAARTPAEIQLPVFTTSVQGTIVHMNASCLSFLGERPKMLEHVFGSELPRSGDVVQLKTRNGTKWVVVAEIENENESCEWYLIPALGRADGEINADWDEIEDLPLPLLKIAADGAIIGSNREARGLLGIASPKDRKLGDVLDGLGRPINDWIREAVEGRGSNVTQFLRGRGDHQDTFVQVTLNRAGQANSRHLIAVLNDVTELKTLERQFVQSQKMQAIGQLAGGVAHDFNNLLTAISGHCDLLLLRHDHGDQNYGDLIQIHQNANRAASLVGQLLAFSRKQNLQPEIVDLRETLSDLTHLLNRLVGEKVVLQVSHDPLLDHMKADKRQLEQVFMNLVVNARDAMSRGGRILIKTRNLNYPKQITRDRAVVPPGNYVEVTVSDEGCGIPPERMPQIFEPFYTSKKLGEGTGLGLSTA